MGRSANVSFEVCRGKHQHQAQDTIEKQKEKSHKSHPAARLLQGNQRQPYLLRGAFEPQKERKPDRSVVNRSIALLLNSEASCGICDDSRVKDVHSLWMDAS